MTPIPCGDLDHVCFLCKIPLYGCGGYDMGDGYFTCDSLLCLRQLGSHDQKRRIDVLIDEVKQKSLEHRDWWHGLAPRAVKILEAQ